MQTIEDKIDAKSLVEWDRLCAIYDLLRDKPHFDKFWEIALKQKKITKENFNKLLKEIKAHWKKLEQGGKDDTQPLQI